MQTRNIYLDFESYYDSSTFTLSKMATEEYIKDDRFEATVLTVATDTSPVMAVIGKDIEKVLVGLQLEREGTRVHAHNMRFDGAILAMRYDIHPWQLACTMAMGRMVGTSRLTRESLAFVLKFLREQGKIAVEKGDFIANMSGRAFDSLTPKELEAFLTYARTDTDALRQVAKLYHPHMTEDTYEFIDMTLKMYTQPVFELNRPLLEEYTVKLHEKHIEAQNNLMGIFNFASVEDFLSSVRSAKKFGGLLAQLGVETPMKLSEKKTATLRKKLLADDPEADVSDVEVMTPALSKTDLEFRDLEEHDDPRVVALVTAKLENNSSIAESRARTLLSVATRGRMSIPLEPLAAWTGRYTAGTRDEEAKSDNINLQNLNKRQGDKTLRRSLVAPEGYVIVAGDSAQVEARMGAYIAQELELLNGFRNGDDVYVAMASTIYNLPAEEISYYAKGEGRHDKVKGFVGFVQRNVGKETILSSQYQISGRQFAKRLRQNRILLKPFDHELEGDEAIEWHNKESARINRVYRSKYANIKTMWDVCEEVLGALVRGESGTFGGPNGDLFFYDGQHTVFDKVVPGIKFPDGYWLLYPGLTYDYNVDKDNWGYSFLETAKGKTVRKNIYGGLLMNNITQGISFAAMRWQAVRINREVRVLLNVHDEWVSIVPEADVPRVIEVYERWMKTCPPWLEGMPFNCEVSTGYNYGDIE